MALEEDLLTLEEKVLAAAAGGWLNAIEEIRLLLVTEPEKVRRRLLSMTAPSIDGVVFKALAEAFGLGVDDAVEVVTPKPKDEKKHRAAAAKEGVSKAAVQATNGLTSKAKAAIAMSTRLLASGASEREALTPLLRAARYVKASVSWAINTAANDGEVVVARSANLPLVWEAERDGCVHCLRYAGEVSRTGLFKPGLTYGKTPLKTKGAPSCPLHPHCRCRMRPLRDPSYAAALRREADRSILRGFSLPSESMNARLAAAEKLLASGVAAPASVKGVARKAIKAGGFASRRVGE